MSSIPKRRRTVIIDPEWRRRQEEERRRREAEAERRRQEQMERERLRRLQQEKQRSLNQLIAEQSAVTQAAGDIGGADADQLRSRCEQMQREITQAGSQAELSAIAARLGSIAMDLQRARERERIRRLERKRADARGKLQQAAKGLSQGELRLTAADNKQLQQQIDALTRLINNADRIEELAPVPAEIAQLNTEIRKAERRKAQQNVHVQHEKQEQELDQAKNIAERAQQQLNEQQAALEQQSADHNANDIREHSLPSVDTASTLGVSLEQQAVPVTLEPDELDAKIQRALAALEAAQQRELQQQQPLAEQRAACLQSLVELSGIAAGLKENPSVLQWEADQLKALEQLVIRAETAAEAGNLADVQTALRQARELEAEIQTAVSAADYNAAQRQYIAASIQDALLEMGFNVSEIAASNPDDPESDLTLTGWTTTRSINVSVPLEPEECVSYVIDGYKMEERARSDGAGVAAVCDTAVEELGNLHALLAEQYGVGGDELFWEDQDPLDRERAYSSTEDEDVIETSPGYQRGEP